MASAGHTYAVSATPLPGSKIPFSALPELGTSVPISSEAFCATVAPVSGSRATVFAAEHAVVVTGVVQPAT